MTGEDRLELVRRCFALISERAGPIKSRRRYDVADLSIEWARTDAMGRSVGSGGIWMDEKNVLDSTTLWIKPHTLVFSVSIPVQDRRAKEAIEALLSHDDWIKNVEMADYALGVLREHMVLDDLSQV
jgi:hypothetical protein